MQRSQIILSARSDCLTGYGAVRNPHRALCFRCFFFFGGWGGGGGGCFVFLICYIYIYIYISSFLPLHMSWKFSLSLNFIACILKWKFSDYYFFVFYIISLKVHSWTAQLTFIWFFWILCFPRMLFARDIPVPLPIWNGIALYSEPENLENIVWIAEFWLRT